MLPANVSTQTDLLYACVVFLWRHKARPCRKNSPCVRTDRKLVTRHAQYKCIKVTIFVCRRRGGRRGLVIRDLNGWRAWDHVALYMWRHSRSLLDEIECYSVIWQPVGNAGDFIAALNTFSFILPRTKPTRLGAITSVSGGSLGAQEARLWTMIGADQNESFVSSDPIF